MTNHPDRYEVKNDINHGAAVDLTKMSRLGHRAGEFSLTLYGSGFEAIRYLNRDEMERLRDWIAVELAKEAA